MMDTQHFQRPFRSVESRVRLCEFSKSSPRMPPRPPTPAIREREEKRVVGSSA